MGVDEECLRDLIERALAEDVGQGDWSSMWTMPPNAIARGRVVAREGGVLAGVEVAQRVFERVNALIAFSPLKEDGDEIAAGDELATVVGPAVSVFTAERTALNFLEHMSGIATLTRRYVKAVHDTEAVILGTRKTVPGLREIDHWAVCIGGGGAHRARLDEMVVVRSGHIAIAGGVAAALEGVRRFNTGLQVVIEVRNREQLEQALLQEPDHIMLSGMSVAEIAEAVSVVAGRVTLEAAGEFTPEEARAIAEAGVDYISVGALTQRAGVVRIGLEIEEENR